MVKPPAFTFSFTLEFLFLPFFQRRATATADARANLTAPIDTPRAMGAARRDLEPIPMTLEVRAKVPAERDQSAADAVADALLPKDRRPGS